MFILLILNKLIPNYIYQITKKASSFEEAFVLYLEKTSNLIVKELYDFYELLE